MTAYSRALEVGVSEPHYLALMLEYQAVKDGPADIEIVEFGDLLNEREAD
jgi:hypothetical protein